VEDDMAMTSQERDVITGIFERLKAAANQPREPEAERYIADLIAKQPYAPYVMAQTIFVHEQALTNMQQRVEALEAELAEVRAQKAPQSGGFLSGIFGNSAPREPDRSAYEQQRYQPPPQQPSGPWGQQQPGMAPNQGGYNQGGPNQGGPWAQAQPQPQQRGGFGGGFLGTAVTTAAGVAGGMLLANSLSSMFGGHSGAAHAADSFSSGFLGGNQGDASQRYDDGYQDAMQDAQDDASLRAQDAYDDGVQDAADYDSGGFDGGGDSYDL